MRFEGSPKHDVAGTIGLALYTESKVGPEPNTTSDGIAISE
jgi:hypothetical protein